MSSWQLGQTIVAALRDAGIKHFVLCPGSRNTPISLSLAKAAQADELTLHTRTDERAAGFLALGLAKAAGVAAVVVTSGTALGNLVPAVMEAYAAGVALVIVSADRPATLVGTRANQTTNQINIFNPHTVAELWLHSANAQPTAWASQINRVVAAALGGRTNRPGPIHINAAFDLPLTPDGAVLPSLPHLTLAPRPPAVPVNLPAINETVVVAGDASPEVGGQAAQFAASACLPLLAEPSSNARQSPNAVQDYVAKLSTKLADRIRRVVLFGHPTLSRPVTRLLAREDIDVVAVGAFADWADAGHRVTLVADAVTCPSGDGQWLNEWRAPLAVSEQKEGLTSTTLVSKVVSGASGQTVFFGSSNPIRYADQLSQWPGRLTCFANRGLSGIDGAIATATGISLGLNMPVTAILGDLTFLYDIGSLMIPAGQPTPDLRLVVIDDNGGSIFDALEVSHPEFSDVFELAFRMPHGHDLCAMASGFGVAASRITTLDELQDALSKPIDGLEVFLVTVIGAQSRLGAVK